MSAGLGIPGHCPGYFESCVLISQVSEPDAKTLYIAYACLHTYRRTYSIQCIVTKYIFRNCASNAVQPSLARVPTQLCRHLWCVPVYQDLCSLHISCSLHMCGRQPKNEASLQIHVTCHVACSRKYKIGRDWKSMKQVWILWRHLVVSGITCTKCCFSIWIIIVLSLASSVILQQWSPATLTVLLFVTKWILTGMAFKGH